MIDNGDFMEYRLGNSRKVKSRGETQQLICPKCAKNVKMGVFSNFERRLAVKPTLLDLNTVYFLVCPECASVFTVDEITGDEFVKGRKNVIEEWDLTEPVEFKAE